MIRVSVEVSIRDVMHLGVVMLGEVFFDCVEAMYDEPSGGTTLCMTGGTTLRVNESREELKAMVASVLDDLARRHTLAETPPEGEG